VRSALRGVADVDRITARIALRSARPRDLSALRESLLRLPELAALRSPLPRAAAGRDRRLRSPSPPSRSPCCTPRSPPSPPPWCATAA
jgi:DNA mismatch repair ATPase MutS